MAKYYNIPCRNGGPLSDVKEADWQAGVEGIMTMLHTMMYLRKELYTPKFFNKMSYDSWQNSGKTSVIDLALKGADRHIAAGEPVEMCAEQEAVLRGYVGVFVDTFQ